MTEEKEYAKPCDDVNEGDMVMFNDLIKHTELWSQEGTRWSPDATKVRFFNGEKKVVKVDKNARRIIVDDWTSFPRDWLFVRGVDYE